jgi:hypothetical protein
MKSSFIALVCLAVIGQCFSYPEEIKENYLKKLSDTKENPTAPSIIDLGRILSGIARNMNPTDPDDYGFYKEFQNGMMEIPGCVEYFVEKLEHERQLTAHLPYGVGARTSYQSLRKWYILETFPHLPAPETIKALGEYLYDDSDAPPPPRPGRNPGGISSNSILASNVLTRIGLIDPPRHNLKAQKSGGRRSRPENAGLPSTASR